MTVGIKYETDRCELPNSIPGDSPVRSLQFKHQHPLSIMAAIQGGIFHPGIDLIRAGAFQPGWEAAALAAFRQSSAARGDIPITGE
jgi:hypothetical protein